MRLWPLKPKPALPEPDLYADHNGGGANGYGYASMDEAYAAHQGWLVVDNVQKSYK